MLTTVTSSLDFRKIGEEFHYRARRLQDLVESAPQQIREMKGYGDYFLYVGAEVDRANSCGINLTLSPGFTVSSIRGTLNWDAPSPQQIGYTVTVASGTTGVIAGIAVTYTEEDPSLGLFQDPPETFRLLKTTNETVQNLNEVKPGLGDSWQSAWNAAALENVESVKSVAAYARTVVDELSWKTPYEHLKTLPWCRRDDRDNPTRATRYAWILHGDTLPEELNNHPSNDQVWQTFRGAYESLQKYVHVAPITKSDVIYVETHLRTMQVGLEQYLREGLARLTQRNSNTSKSTQSQISHQ